MKREQMNNNSIFQNSITGRLCRTVSTYWRNSLFFNTFSSMGNWFHDVSQNSRFIQWLTNSSCGISTWFQNSFLVTACIPFIFNFAETCMKRVKNVFNNSITEQVLLKLRRDLKENGISCIFSFFFSFIVVFVGCTLFFGVGFSRQAVYLLFGVIVATFILSFIHVSPRIVIQESKVWQWINQIFQ